MKEVPVASGRARHAWLAAAALLSVAVALAAVHLGMARLIRAHTAEFDVYPFPEKLIGLALQKQAFADASLLPVYGSSELTQPQANRADDFFAGHPTGFGTFLIGNPGETCLIIATKLAALGPETRGRRTVVFLSPGWFLEPELDHKGFGVNFSPLQGNVFAFQSKLDALLKQDIARRLLDYPETVGQSVLLDAALRGFVAPSIPNRAVAAALRPAALAQTTIQQELEYVRLWDWWRRPHPARKMPGQAANGKMLMVNWAARLRLLDKEYEREPKLTSYSTGPRTPYDNARQALFRDAGHPGTSPDENFARACGTSKEWTDLELLLRVAREKEIRLLVVCQPLNAKFARLQGLTDRSIALFYDRLRQVSAPYKTQLTTFPQGEKDAHFYQDSVHPSGKGWIEYDAAMDAFYHERDGVDQGETH